METIGDFLEQYFTNNANLRSEIRSINYENNGDVFTFFSDLGVFSKNKIDLGSDILVNTILKNTDDDNLTILDVGCGYGFIGITLAKKLNSVVDMVDVNKRAIHLAERNIKENKVNAKAFYSNIYENVENKYDLIVSNPPIRAGKKVVYEILKNARKHLNKIGILWFVIRKDKGAKSTIKDLSDLYKIDVLEKEKGFYVMRAEIS